jgi:hypothetical protein
MSYLLGYKMQFTNVEETIVTVNIYDTLSGEGETVFTEIEGAEDPCHISVTDNEEEKFTPIKAKQAEIKFLSTTETNLSSFSTPEDRRWYVEIFLGDVIQFKGFLILDDADEDFLDSEYSNTVTLLATDNIGLLKDEPLTNFTDNNPRGYFNLITYVAWCLKKTGLSLNINVVHNVKEEHDSTRVMYETCFLQSKTFEAEINESTDCYEVLEQILGNDCYLTQAGGEWWIIRVDDLQDNETYNNVFDSNGVFVRQETFDIPLRIDPELEVMFFSDMATFVKFQQPVREAKLTYDYKLPKEIIDNIDFSRGRLLTPVVVESKQDDKGKTLTGAAYNLDDWALKAGTFTSNVPTVTSTYIERYFNSDGIESERYAIINQTGVDTPHWLESNAIPVCYFDKFTLQIDFRLSVRDVILGVTTKLKIFLKGDDGEVYLLTGNPRQEARSIVLGEEYSLKWEVYRGQDDGLKYDSSLKNGKWITFDVGDTVAPVPVDGNIYVTLPGMRGAKTYWQNLRFDYKPYISGSYAKYDGQYNKISQAIRNTKVYEDNVELSDSPKKLFKGALHIAAVGPATDTRFQLAGRFYDGRQFNEVPEDDYLHPFGFNQAYCVWNQYNRVFRIFDFQLQGLNGGSVFPDIIGKYTIGEDSAHTMNKLFMMLHYDQDLNLCEWSGVMVEFFDTTIPKDYASPLEFKYITGK